MVRGYPTCIGCILTGHIHMWYYKTKWYSDIYYNIKYNDIYYDIDWDIANNNDIMWWNCNQGDNINVNIEMLPSLMIMLSIFLIQRCLWLPMIV